MVTALDILLVIAAIGVMLAGIAYRKSLWSSGYPEQQKPRWSNLLFYLIGHKQIVRRRAAGAAHLILVWGFIIFLVVVILAQIPAVVLSETIAGIISLMLDVLGLLMLAGTLFFVFRYSGLKRLPDSRDVKRGVMLPAAMLLFILISGFMAEAVRLGITAPQVVWASPLGSGLSALMPESPLLMQVIIRLHLLAVLFFIALIPFTFMRHIINASYNVAFPRSKLPGRMRQLDLPHGHIGAGAASDFSWKQLLESDACVTCGRCVENCPAALSGKTLSPRRIVQAVIRQMEEEGSNKVSADADQSIMLESAVGDEEIWDCTACLACVEQCPVFVDPADKILSMRRYRVLSKGSIPEEAKPAIRNLELFGDVQGKGRAFRMEWAIDCQVPVLSEKKPSTDVLFWVGCSGAFHPRYQEAARDMVKILNKAAVDFAVLGDQEFCCGDPAGRMGGEDLFIDLVKKNLSCLSRYDFKKIVCLCPHCFNTLKNEYSRMGGAFEVVHAAQYLTELMDKGLIEMKYPVAESLTIHDPCYLARANHISRPLREISRRLPGAELREMPRCRENTFCCGGGGGHMWLHETGGTHINQIRAQEASELNTKLIATACPYCLTMIEDGLGGLEKENPPRVRDLVELVAEAIG